MKPTIMLPLENAYFIVDTLKSATQLYCAMRVWDDIGEITRQILLQRLSDVNKAIGMLVPLIPNNLGMS